MTLKQIAGLMLYSSHQSIPSGGRGFFFGTYNGKPYNESGAEPSDLSDNQKDFLTNDNLRHVLITSVESPEVAARWNNNAQALVEGIGLGIPVNISSDPRHRTRADAKYNAGAAGNISMWPGSLGLAATFDPEIVQQFGEIASVEYRALGIATALSPQIDLATDPRWNRVSGTFGEDPQLAADMARAYIDGFQTSPDTNEISSGWGYASVNAMAKHWPGGGAGEGGRDWFGNHTPERLENPVNMDIAQKYFNVTEKPDVADVALVFINSPQTGRGYQGDDVKSGATVIFPLVCSMEVIRQHMPVNRVSPEATRRNHLQTERIKVSPL